MSKQHDEHISLVGALASARAELQSAAAEVANAPAYLRSGAEGIEDAAMQAAAEHIAARRKQAMAARKTIIALQTALDETDLGPDDAAADLRAENAVLAWLNAVVSSDQLLAELKPDPRRRFRAPGDAAMQTVTADRILQHRADAGGAIQSAATLQAGAALSPLDVADLMFTGRLLADAPAEGQSVGVLLPLRIETRFTPPNADAPGWTLRLRLYPEAAGFDRDPGPPTAAEQQHTLEMWQACDGKLDTFKGELAFQKLVEQHGGPRAAWLARSLPVLRATPDGPITLGGGPPRGVNDRRFQRPVGLPEQLEIWIGRGGAAPVKVADLAVAVPEIAEQVTIDQWDPDAGLPVTWWLSFAEAVRLGLACSIDLGALPPDDIDVLYVVGLGEDSPAALFESHRVAGSLAVVAPGTPTNSVAGAPAADLGRDPAVWRRLARETGLDQPAPRELELALTGGAAGLAPLPGGEVDVRSPAEALVGALWPVLWGRALKDFLGLGMSAWSLGQWAVRCLAPGGPYPAIRIGEQPYGVLPVSSLARWRSHVADPAIEARMIEPLQVLLRRWQQAGEATGTVIGADTERLLDVLAHTPTARWAWRLALSHDLIQFASLALGAALPTATLRSDFDDDVVSTLIAKFGLKPLRRYASLGPARVLDSELARVTDPRVLLQIQATPGNRSIPPSERPIGRMLRSELDNEGELVRTPDPYWWGLQGQQDDEDPVPLLARLVRHALIITRAEVLRLARDPALAANPALILPFDRANDALFEFAIPTEPLRKAVEALGPVGSAAVRAWYEVREGAEALFPQHPARLHQALLATLDAASHRIDPWVTGLATRRLRSLAARAVPFRLGVYGWVDAPRPYSRRLAGTGVRPPGPTDGGLLHAPGMTQAMTSALLRDLVLRNPTDKRWDIALDSASVRVAVQLSTQVKAGIHIKEALGREIERIAGDPAQVLLLRQQFPMRPEHAGRRVCDGEAVLAAARANPPTLPAALAALGPEIAPLQEVIDTYGDLLVTDAVFDMVSGRAERAAEAMEAAAGLGPPSDLRALRADRGGRTVTTTVLLAIPADAAPAADTGPLETADPAFARLVEDEAGAAAAWQWEVDLDGAAVSVSLAALGLHPVDTLTVPLAEIERRVREQAAAPPGAGVEGEDIAGRVARVRRLAELLSGEAGLPDFLLADAADAVAELAGRLELVRTAATALVTDLRAADPAGALQQIHRWGILREPELDDAEAGEDAAEVLEERLDASTGPVIPAGLAELDAIAARGLAADLRVAIRNLTGAAAIPVLCTLPQASLAGLTAAAFDTLWLEVVAAVRPPLARLDAHQLLKTELEAAPWQAWSTHPNDPWCVAAAEPAPPPLGSAHQVRIVYGPPAALNVGGAERIAVSLIDHWAETIPSREHTTGAAFGFNAPKSRAPQAILLAVPPDLDRPLDTETLIDVLAEARSLARARMATPDTLAGVAPVIPFGLLFGANPAGVDLERMKP